MIKKICFYSFLFFVFILNIMLNLNTNLYVIICSIIALISILIILDIILIFFKKQEQNRGINFKTEDGTCGTANWMDKKEMKQVLGFNETPGIILGKYNNKIIKLPFESHFNKNICVFGSSR